VTKIAFLLTLTAWALAVVPWLRREIPLQLPNS